ncbi:MAG: glycine--tRNA ligase subunit beta [Anaerolineae bacterium]
MMTPPLNFQQIILTLQQFWADRGCTIWQPYHVTVGAGTANPGTILRVLGPEPWNVAYVEPSFRPDDGRYGDNPNRMQMHTQFQVILQPDPGDPQEQYLASLFALGLDPEEHDIRFVEDNWESPALGAWGLGWEVWLDGMEISQYTYFQQSGGFTLDPVAVELTYGLERIALYLQGVDRVWDIDWDGRQTYGELLLRQEIEHCIYNFELADIDGLTELYNFYEAEALRCLERGLVIPAHDYVLQCSHAFNILDTRGAIGVTERAAYFGRMRRLSHLVAEAFSRQRQELGHPLLKYMPDRETRPRSQRQQQTGEREPKPFAPFVLEIGSEELPAREVTTAIAHLEAAVPDFLAGLRLPVSEDTIKVAGTPRRLVVYIDSLPGRQQDFEETFRGPAAKVAFDAGGQPTKAALGFARSKGVEVADLEVRDLDGGQYVVATVKTEGRPSTEVLAEALPDLIKGIPFGKSMRWLASAQVGREVAGTTYSRPIRWLVALFGAEIVPFDYAGVASERTSRGLRPEGSPGIDIADAGSYFQTMAGQRIAVDFNERRASIQAQIQALAAEVGGRVPDDPDLLEEVTNLVEQPTAFLGTFDETHLALPEPVLVTVMKKHQRYFPVVKDEGRKTKDEGPGFVVRRSSFVSGSSGGSLLPYFIAVRNGGGVHLDTVRAGNEGVLRARFADADFFFKADTSHKLEEFLPRLDTLVFQEKLGSMLDKSRRLETLAPQIGERLHLTAGEIKTAERAARLSKADLATQMVVEFTGLQGVMGYEYARLSGEPEPVAVAIMEHYLPHGLGGSLPQTGPGIALNLANRLDSLAGLFAVGLAPSGSADPFGLRRDGLSLVTILLEKELDFSVAEGLELAAALQPVPVPPEALAASRDFVRRRLEGLLRERGLPHDVVQAVLADPACGDTPHRARQAAEILARWVRRDDWSEVLNAYARCVRILPREWRAAGDRSGPAIQPALFTEQPTRDLHAAYERARAALSPASTFEAVLAEIEGLVQPINTFFDEVLVMADDEAIRQNRLALLKGIRDLTQGYADLSHLQGF